jgi:pimeloyl-ACP methyl ester carboxylesterase
VLLIPGFLCGDDSMRTLAAFLETRGYRPYPSGIACNADCSEAALRRLRQRIAALSDGDRQRVALVGHSRGGLFARVLAVRCPDLVSGVVTLGCPRRDPAWIHPALWGQALGIALLASLGVPGLMSLACCAGTCCQRVRRDLAAPLPHTVGLLSIYSRNDAIVDWRSCLDPSGRHTEVRAGHHEMPADAATMRAVVSALATFPDCAVTGTGVDRAARAECPRA